MTKRILIVEDDDAVRHVLSDVLQEAGYAVATAIDGFDALDVVDEHPPDAILLDLIMPSMDGWSFLERFRGRSCADGIPVGIISGTPRLLKTADAWGVQVAIGKPFQLDALISQVDRLCNPLVL